MGSRVSLAHQLHRLDPTHCPEVGDPYDVFDSDSQDLSAHFLSPLAESSPYDDTGWLSWGLATDPATLESPLNDWASVPPSTADNSSWKSGASSLLYEPWLPSTPASTRGDIMLTGAFAYRSAYPESSISLDSIPSGCGNTVQSEGRESVRSNDAYRYTCKCGKAYANSYKLEQHAKSSSHDTYECPEIGCGRSYHRRDSYVRHLASHRNGDSHACRLCARHGKPKAFKRRDHLRQHERNCHPTELTTLDVRKLAGSKRSCSAVRDRPCSFPRLWDSPASTGLRSCTASGERVGIPGLCLPSVHPDATGCQWQDVTPTTQHQSRAVEIADVLKTELGHGHGDVVKQIEKVLDVNSRLDNAGYHAPSAQAVDSRQGT